MSARPTSVFLERDTYRRRRIMDAARILPLVGVALFAVPLLWGNANDPTDTSEPVSTSVAVFYIFGVWGILIVCSALFGLKSRGWGPGSDSSGGA